MARKKVRQCVGDFETTTDPADCRVWAAGVVDITSLETLLISNNLDDFMVWLSREPTEIYFHNLKFDAQFIISWLLRNGWSYSEGREEHTFNTLISDGGVYYSMEIIFRRTKTRVIRTKIYDSLKKLPFPVAKIAKAFNLPDEKLTIDYQAARQIGHVLTEEEREYLVHDCRIVAAALRIQMGEGLTHMTNASDAMHEYKEIVGQRYFDYHFPVLPVELDDDLRQAYKGGFTCLNKKHRLERGLQGVSFDVNSLYPSVMYNKLLPFGYPIFFEGKPNPDEDHPLFIVRLECSFRIKPDHVPTIQIKKSPSFVPTKYVESTLDLKTGVYEVVPLTLTSVDLALFLDHYEVDDLRYICGWKFKACTGMFTDYIDKWMAIKATSTGAIRQLAKLMLNSLYGKFASSTLNRKKVPSIDDEGIVHYSDVTDDARDPVYTPVAAFITAWARDKTIRSAQAVYDRWIYCDTDSLHIIGTEEPEGMEIHPTDLGAWKNEGVFTDSLFLRAKTYMETKDGTTTVTCAGMPDNVKKLVTYENFKPGSSFPGKLVPQIVPGGCVLVERNFTIK